MKNSAASPRSERPAILGEVAAVVFGLCALAAVAVWWFYNRGYILYYGDAQAHLNISRSIIDSRTPGYEQLGSVWLPLLHVICLPWVRSNWLWSTGLAGSIPVSICFVITGTCFYLAAKETYESSLAAVVVLCCFALNPNVLYLASIPMTEVVSLAGVAVTLLSLLRFQRTQQRIWIALALLASWAMSLTRYDGWFLIPFTAIWFAAFARNHRRAVLVSFGVIASLAPLYWLAHCWWETGNALDFYNGPY
ncbi:MAG: glycosyltransferase family 39 protein, partial [Acidobacteriota bacterium]|nr:glycosyltransferase family 39 protein [Acidobacteriota bacterium]